MPKRIDEKIISVSTGGKTSVGPVDFEGDASATVGHFTGHADADLEDGTFDAGVEIISAESRAHGEVKTPVGGADGTAWAEGPSGHADAAASTDAIGGTAGVSAGSIGGDVSGDVAGEHFEAGLSAGAKAEIGLELGPTTEIDLPFISAKVPNPGVAAAHWGAKAVSKLVHDPVGTVENAVDDAKGVVSDAIDDAKDAVHTVVNAAKNAWNGIVGGGDDEDDNVVTTDVPQGPSGKGKPGSHPFD